MSWAVLTHGGAATPRDQNQGCVAAAERARDILVRGGTADAAALEATVLLEDEPRYNAGTGSNLRLDGKTVQMDAAIASSDGRFGAVACIEAVKNPILVAARVRETPHLMLVGEGATAFARRLGFPPYNPLIERIEQKYARAMAELAGHGDGYFADDAAPWRGIGISQVWNFETPIPAAAGSAASTAASTTMASTSPTAGSNSPATPPSLKGGCDTVGAVVRDAQGNFCATASTGGTVYMLRGRVGDSPLIGCGLFAGPAGAVACTGIGEEIARKVLAKTVHDWLEQGMSPEAAGAKAVALFPQAVDVGLLIAGRAGQAVAANRDMAAALLVG